MPRLARIDLPGMFYHVMARGIERCAIFRRTIDYQDFLDRLAEGLEKTQSLCLAWALMPNHIHLLILAGASGLANLLHPLLTGYATAFNLRYQRTGHLFQNRFKSILCEKDPYVRELLRYIPLNPKRSGIVHTPEELARYPWTGHSALMGLVARPWQAVDAALGMFGEKLGEARSAYERYLLDGWTLGKQKHLEGGGLIRPPKGLSIAPQASDIRILGGGDFVEKIWRLADEQETQSDRLKRSWSLEDLKIELARRGGVDPDDITRLDRRRPVARARALLIFAATEWLGKSTKEMADYLHIASGSTSESRQRGKRLANEGRWLDFLKTTE
jgi:REP element-mobilizing transposase RayT